MEVELKMMVNNIEEQDFLLSHLNKRKRVLEFGSGASTLTIAPLVKELISIEHNETWYNDILSRIPNNVKLHHIPQNNEPTKEYDDGTYDDFKDYINFATTLGKFDIIFIDGRARVECAKIACQLLNKNGLIFIHDYNHPNPKYHRTEYDIVEQFLDRIDGVFTMYKFKPKV